MSDLLLYPPLGGKDGFLATNSLLGFAVLLTRAYAAEFGSNADWQDAVDCLEPLISNTAATSEAWKAAMTPLWARSTTLVLHGPSTWIGAVDLESKFTEAALGHIQLADYRNFAHGRHHWLAKRSETSSVLAFITDEDRALAERTLDLIPRDIPQARILFEGGRNAVALSSLVAALRITGWAGLVRGIDPGRPGVPEFGRKLYNLPFPRPRRVAGLPRLTPRETAAITRKAGLDPGSLAASGALGRWRDALGVFSTVCAMPASRASSWTTTARWSTFGIGQNPRNLKCSLNLPASPKRVFTSQSQLAGVDRSGATFRAAYRALSGLSFSLVTITAQRSHRFMTMALRMDPGTSPSRSNQSPKPCAVIRSSPNTYTRKTALSKSRLRSPASCPRVGFGISSAKLPD